MSSVLETRILHVSVEGKPILNGVNLVVKQGEIHALMGPNGTGKSTIMRVITGEVRPDGDGASAVEALGCALGTLAWRNADASVTLSNHFVRLALVPSAGEVARGAERLALARHQLRLVYGERADAWEAVLGEPGSGAGVVAAMDPTLGVALRDALGAASIGLKALRPFLADAFNSARAFLAPGPAWLGVVEPGRVCVAHLDGARWLALRSQRVQGAPESATGIRTPV